MVDDNGQEEIEQTPKTHFLPEDLAKDLLEQYFFEHGPYRVEIIPKRIDPDFADKFIRERVETDAEAVLCRHARQFIDFYDLRQTLPHFQDFLDKSESDGPGLSRSTQIVMMLGSVGDEAEWKFADDYMQQQLLSCAPAREQLAGLLRCWATLGPSSSPDKLEKLFADEVGLRERTRNRGDDAELRYQQLQSVYANDLPRAKRGVAYRAKVEQMKGDARLKALIQNYARLDDYPPEYLNDWAARMLRHAAAESDEARANVVKQIRAVLGEAEGSKSLDGDTKRFVKRRLLRAVQYFDETQLSENEHHFLATELRESAAGDLLSTVQPREVPEAAGRP